MAGHDLTHDLTQMDYCTVGEVVKVSSKYPEVLGSSPGHVDQFIG